MGFSLKKLGKAIAKPLKSTVGAVKAVGRSVDVTAKSSSIRAGMRSVDKMVGGAQGWGRVAVVAGTVVAATGLGTAAGAAIAAGGKTLAAKGAADDAAREQKKQQEAIERELAAQVAADGGPVAPGLGAIGAPGVSPPQPGTIVATKPLGPSLPPAVPAAGAAALGMLLLGPIGLVAAVPAFLLAKR